MLLAKNANVYATDYDGKKPIDYAVSPQLIAELKTLVADIDAVEAESTQKRAKLS